MPAMNVQSSMQISASADSIMAVISDFQTWPTWSPWLYTEPDATINYVGNAGEAGHGYDWRGDKTGAGSMSLLRKEELALHCDLNFLKPFKSQADVAFELQSHSPETTTVTWKMDSQLPFFMFFFKGTMVGMIRSDYNRGLLMLKDFIESGEVPSNAFIEGVVDVDSLHYAGYRGEASISELSTAIGERFRALSEAASNSSGNSSGDVKGMPLCFYDHMDIKNGRCTFTAALPVSTQQSFAAPLESMQRPACKALKLVHTGAYRHLGNAWATIMSEARARKYKMNKKISPFECYMNDPDNTDEKDLITEVYLPLRG